MLRPSDTLVLFAVSQTTDRNWTIRSLAEGLGVAHPKVQRALDRLSDAGLYDARRRAVRGTAAAEFAVHALKYLQPVAAGPHTRGVPTGWSAAPLRDLISNNDDDLLVWPDPHGTVRGAAVEPLDPVVPRLAERWPAVAELAALADGVRLGDRRTRQLAADMLSERLQAREHGPA